MRKVLTYYAVYILFSYNAFSQHFIEFTDLKLFLNEVQLEGIGRLSYEVTHIPDRQDVEPATITPIVPVFENIFFSNKNTYSIFFCEGSTVAGSNVNPCCGSNCRKNLLSDHFCLDPRLEFENQVYSIKITMFRLGNTDIVTTVNPVTILLDAENNSPVNINLGMGYILRSLRFKVTEVPGIVNYDLFRENVLIPGVNQTNLEQCDNYNGSENRNFRYYNNCQLEAEEFIVLEVSTNDLNYYLIENQDENPPVTEPVHHDFQINLKGQTSAQPLADFEPIGVTTNGGSRVTRYRHSFDFIDPSPVALPGLPEDDYLTNNYSTDVFEVYTDYEVTVCEFRHCGGSSGSSCCKVSGLVDFDDNRQVRSKRFIYRTYKPLTWLFTEKINPCKENRTGAWGFPAGSLSILGAYTQYGQIKGDLNKRIGGYDKGTYTAMLCKDDNPQAGYQGSDCDICVSRTVSVDGSGPKEFNFSYLPSGDYKLTIYSDDAQYKNCGIFEEFYTLQTLDPNDPNALLLEVTPNPAFICPVEFGKGLSSSVTLNATEGFDTYKWIYVCSGSQTAVSTTDEYTVNRGKGGLYELKVSRANGCEQTIPVKVIDLNLPGITYHSLSDVLQNNAVKYEHTTSPVLSSMPWSDPQGLRDYDAMNSYLSGKSGIYRGKQTFDYLDTRNKLALSNQNTDIKGSGLYHDVSIFNWQHPGLLLCEPEWKLNNTVNKFNLGSYPVENKDILGLYSSGLYGFNGKLPIAVTQLGKYQEIAFESFEEYEDDQIIDQLSNAAGNFDLVNQIKKGEVLYYEEFEVSIGMSNYGITKMPQPASCPDDFFVADVICRSISNEPIGCDGSKSIEAEVPDVKIKIIPDPCLQEEGILVEFDSKAVPPFSGCLPWNGIIRTKNYKSYTEHIDNTAYVFVSADRAHTGTKSLLLLPKTGGLQFENRDIILEPDKEYILSFWVSTEGNMGKNAHDLNLFNRNNKISVDIRTDSYVSGSNTFFPKGPPVNGWQKIDAVFKTGGLGGYLTLYFDPQQPMYIDDVRFSPMNGGMQTYVYEPETYRLISILDPNNYATIYKYDDQGNLFLVQKETVEGIKTIQMNQSYMSANH